MRLKLSDRFLRRAAVGAALLSATSARGWAQEERITGHIIDAESRTPVPAAVVLIQGTTIGMNTTDSGTFSLRRPADAKVLTVRRIGYLAQTVSLAAGQADYTVSLRRDVLHLEAEVVTGVATSVSAQSSANAVAVVTTQQVNEVPSPTIENALQGMIPGALIQQNNGGAPGGGMQIQIRGITSINANASPLYVLDGVIVDNETQNGGNNSITAAAGGVAPSDQDLGVNRIADLNPEDIESIEVLKGASASAIYGSKASSGVVIITTKKGTVGKPRWAFTQNIGHFEDAHFLNVRQFPTLASAQAWYVNDITLATTPAQIAANNAFIAGVYNGPQDYQATIFGNRQASYETDLSVSGTAGATQYFLSGLSKYDNGPLLNSGYNKQSIRSNITQQFRPNLSVTANLFYSNSVDRRGISGNDNNGISPIDVVSYTPQFVNMNRQNADGSWVLNPFGPANPYADAWDIGTPETTQRFIGGGSFNWTPYSTEHQSLQLTLIGGVDFANVLDELYAPSSLQIEQSLPLPGVSTTQTTNARYINYSVNLIHHYTGLSWLDATTSVGFVRERRDLLNPYTVSQNVIAGVNNPSIGTVQTNIYNRSAQRDQSLYAQEQVLTLSQRLSVTAGVTGERTTNDGDISKFYYYPRFSASYRIPQFVGFLDELKVRAAYGQSGTQPLYGVRYSPFPAVVVSGNPAVGPDTLLGNANIKPESETETELGFDATFLRSRAQFTFTVYQKRINNVLLEAGVNPSRGYIAEWINGGEFTNQGAEISLQGTPVQMRNSFTWTSGLSFYRNYSVVNSIPVAPFAPIGGRNGWIDPGRSVSELVNNRLLLANKEPQQVGDAQPGFDIGWTNALSYGPFRLSAMFEWSKGAWVRNNEDAYFAFGPDLWGDSARSARFIQQTVAGLTPREQPASYAKLRTVSLGYTVPSKWVSQIPGKFVSSARLSLIGRNLLLWWGKGYDGLDPEGSSLGSQNVIRGDQITPYPPSRSYFLSLDLGL
jgi:TonB-linked SusC/RagA family outer membrane protein